MTTPRVTIDANLLASGAVRARPDAASVQLIDAWLRGHFSLILSLHIITQVNRTLAKPYFARRLADADREAFQRLLLRRAITTPITVSVEADATHPEDDLVVATALSGKASFVVTGDYKLARLKSYRGLIFLTVHEFLAMLLGSQSDPRE